MEYLAHEVGEADRTPPEPSGERCERTDMLVMPGSARSLCRQRIPYGHRRDEVDVLWHERDRTRSADDECRTPSRDMTRHHPDSVDQRPRQDRNLVPADHPAPAPRLAVEEPGRPANDSRPNNPATRGIEFTRSGIRPVDPGWANLPASVRGHADVRDERMRAELKHVDLDPASLSVGRESQAPGRRSAVP
jgi:hypothetical protein